MNVDKVWEYIDQRNPTDEERAELAAVLLSDTNCTAEAFRVFFAKLSDIAHGELINRAQDEEERN